MKKKPGKPSPAAKRSSPKPPPKKASKRMARERQPMTDPDSDLPAAEVPETAGPQEPRSNITGVESTPEERSRLRAMAQEYTDNQQPVPRGLRERLAALEQLPE